jgi:V-type H+-transporting ATPase subunit C
MPQYWLVALPVGKQRSKQAVWDTLQDATAAARFSVNHKLEMPELRVGTLDTLMALRYTPRGSLGTGLSGAGALEFWIVLLLKDDPAATSILARSDDLSKSNNMIEAVVNKLKRQVHETGGPAAVGGLKVEGLPSGGP